jgi:S1-C subfamily serine protease
MTGKFAATAAALTVCAFAAGLVVSGRMSLTESGWSAPQVAEPPAVQTAGRTGLGATTGLPNLSDVAERALKVSVNISSTTMRVVNDPFMRFFYGRDLAEPSQSLGSGVVVSSDGYLLTNTHVIGTERADIRVMLADGKEYRGELVGLDDLTDLAVVKIDASGLPTLPWGDSSGLRVAEWVLAVGNPFQLSGTVTLGIISTVNRSASQVGSYRDMIQTDAAINQGNSGGALVNARGELVGINSMIYSDAGGGGFLGIGFAIPSDVARDIMQQLIEHGAVRYGSVGEVRWRAIDRETARYNRLGDTEGVLVVTMLRGSSAYQAGIRPGDIVVSVDGQRTTGPDQLIRVIYAAPVGSTAEFQVVRQGRELTLQVPVVER